MGKKYFLSLLIYIYNLLLYFLTIIVLPLKEKISGKKRWNITKRQRLPLPIRDFRGKSVVWLHGASLGEVKLLLKFCQMLKEKYKEDLYIATATSETGVDFLEKSREPSFCAIGFFPFDTIPLISKVINHYNVKRVWIMETELWPTLLWICKKRNIPLGIVNGRIEEKSFKLYKKFKWFFRPLLESIEIVLAQSDEYAKRFIELGVKESAIKVVGNIKGHIRIERPSKVSWIETRRNLNLNETSFVVTAGCIHSGEGIILRDFFKKMMEYNYPCKLIIVPRYLEETARLLEEIGNNATHITDISTSKKWDICIIEKNGILDEMYKIADVAIIGGTFTNIGGHNVWDAAKYAIPIFFGPYYYKQEESCKKLLDSKVGFMVKDGDELGDKMFEVLKVNPIAFIEAQKKFIEEINKNQSIVEQYLP